MKNRRIKHFVGALALAVMLSSAGGMAHAQEVTYDLLDTVTEEKQVGDRFSISDFNDIWRFIKGILIGDNDTPTDFTDDRISIGGESLRTIDNQDVTFDIGGHLTIPGVLAADMICDDTTCSTVTDILAGGGGGAAALFVGVTGDISSVVDISSFTNGFTPGVMEVDFVAAHESGTAFDGYLAGSAACRAMYYADPVTNAAFEGSRMCTDADILASADELDTSGWDSIPEAWINTGSGKFPTSQATNDCNGWTFLDVTTQDNLGDGKDDFFGNFWNFDTSGGIGKSSFCNQPLQVACCK